jgi:feruloyl-CoA synthase
MHRAWPRHSAPAPWHIPAASSPPSEPATNGSASAGARRAQADAIAHALLDRGLGAGRPLMVLSGNSIEHLVLTLGA